MNKIELRKGDCLELMKDIEDKSIDLTITSPPYDDLRDYNSNINFREIIKQLYRITKNGGIVVWNVNDKIKKGTKSLTSFKQALLFVELGFNLNDTMIWKKTNPMPQVKQPRYNQCFEYMFIFSKGKPKTFNPIMIECKSAGKKYNSTCKIITKGKERKYKEFNINNKKIDNNIWDFAVSQNKTNHSAVFPLELPLRHIKTWSNENDLVLDCFAGSGTTGVACQNLNRNCILMEKEEEYCEIIMERLRNSEKSLLTLN